MKKLLAGSIAAVLLLLTFLLPAGASFQPRYSNIDSFTATAKPTDDGDIQIVARLGTTSAMSLDISASVEQNGQYIGSVSVHKASSRKAALNEVISCASSGRFTVTFTFNAGGETETVTKTVRT